ncbi:hypothetical protein BaRGS_00038684, partial [Batillaria attramentaria]
MEAFQPDLATMQEFESVNVNLSTRAYDQKPYTYPIRDKVAWHRENNSAREKRAVPSRLAGFGSKPVPPGRGEQSRLVHGLCAIKSFRLTPPPANKAYSMSVTCLPLSPG